MNEKEEFLAWLDEQDGYYIDNSLVRENFPNLQFNIIGATGRMNPKTGKIQLPKRDYRQAVKYGQVLD